MTVTGTNELRSVSDGLESVADRHGHHSHRHSIEQTVKRVFGTEVLQRARQNAREHVGSRTQAIRDQSRGWVGDRYRHELTTDNTVVKAHEEGTGRYGGGGSYRIPSSDADGPIVIDTPGGEKVVEFAIHPGVPPQNFMENAVERKSDDVAEEVAEDLVDTIDDAIDI